MLDWSEYIKVATRFQRKVKPADKEDIVSDIILRCAEVESRYNGSGEHLTEGGMMRIGGYVVLSYWRDLMRLPPIISLNETVNDDDGNETEFYQILADDRALNVDNWIDAKMWLAKAPTKLVKIAYKRMIGLPLTSAEYTYLCRARQLKLALM